MASGVVKRVLICVIFLCSLNLSGIAAKSMLRELNEDNWDEMLTKEWMVEFYAPWCPACKALQPAWEEFSTWSEDLGISIGQVDVTASPGLSGRFMVTALPTIFHVLNGEFRQYRGARDKEAFISFIEEQKWKKIDPIPSWKSPGSFQMSVVSYFFKLSQVLRALHNKLMEDYGLPTWGSYLIFAVATIFLGAMLGLMLVCVIDFIYPPKPLVVKTVTVGDVKKKDLITPDSKDRTSGDEMEEEDDDDDDIKDDIVDDDEEEEEEEEEGIESQSDSDVREEGSPNVRKRKPRKAD
ncbi:thioredoxin-related transmembrane protein 1 [Schistocerca cancellata]|uniref:thioredoxin-related transmembrane protein 1 n=1 Tax=Schistocerca cancellata TaxID=274614 RepID=UPI002118D74A|nr:thioredoxin-related transmembrane protein 1 [Schistocerca cancellata]